MKFRIIERKKDNGESYYFIQYRRFWAWRDYIIDELSIGGYDIFNVYQRRVMFDSKESAKSALERTQISHSHNGVTIYPTIDKDIFYSLLGAKRHERLSCYTHLICGSYDSCCRQIDEYLAIKKNREYKKIINL